MIDRPIWHEAASLAARWHQHKRRNDKKTPYVAHPARVAMTIAVIATIQIMAAQDSLLKLFFIEVPPLRDVVEMDGSGNGYRRLTP